MDKEESKNKVKLDRKSSRGMIYENEELRLKTININAEIERGQSDIKKLRRENEMLKKEIWCLRDEYARLDKLLKEKDFSSSSTCSSSDSDCCTSCTEEYQEVETCQNLENVQKTNLKNLHVEFDHLSVVPEENSTENSDKNSTRTSIPNEMVIKPDEGYPDFPTHFFAPLPTTSGYDYFMTPPTPPPPPPPPTTFQPEIVPLQKTSSDIIVKLDNQSFNSRSSTTTTFNNGGNLEELLNDIESISKDILKLSTSQTNLAPYKSELNVVLMPTPMPLIGFEKYHNISASCESISNKPEESQLNFPKLEVFPSLLEQPETPKIEIPDPLDFIKDKQVKTCSSRSNLLDLTSSDHISSENEENKLKRNESLLSPEAKKKQKMSIRRKVSIHFKGKKEKKAEVKPPSPGVEVKLKKTPSVDSKRSLEERSKHVSSGSERNSQVMTAKQQLRKSFSVSPDRKHVHVKEQDKKHKKHKKMGSAALKQRRSTISTDRFHRERSFSVCTDRSNMFEQQKLNAPGAGFGSNYSACDSERERTNSVSSCGSARKMSNIPSFPVSGKIPWCGCWGNGCI
ncbi:PREDICTED: uncharacterized protein LOC108559619 isoform X2 [Nicrophorus vespilloides]|uniref:Uncharacterized protein LOC108559619 isoform X2 n=1 Tax=Nicrophorus vespilloides TaxID=110193 RepID=A0ABM1MCZ3_NICVS|nr:PREDICTED: uncharacterized protein LOC108559619 isoform X2 [Nicrophorus vespilloides]